MLARLASRPYWCSPALGAIAALGFEPLDLWPLTLLALAGLLALLSGVRSWKQAALLGWLFGFGHFTLGNTWIATAFTYQANMPAWLGMFAVVGLAVYLAVFPALATLGAWTLVRHQSPPSPAGRGRGWGSEAARPSVDAGVEPPPQPLPNGEGLSISLALTLAFAASWILAEWLRSWVFTGFVWNPLGMVLLGPFDQPGLARLAPWLGTYGLSGLVVLIAGAVWNIFSPPASTRARAACAVGLALVAMGMTVPVGLTPAKPGTVPYSLIQPNIPQEVLNEPAEFENNFARIVRQTRARPPGERLVLWPESGVMDYLQDGYPAWHYWDTTYGEDPALARGRIARVIGPGATLLTGAVDLDIKDRDIAGARNVVTALDDKGAIRGSYAKAHLVPYGEYLPIRWLLEPLGASRLVPGSIDFLPGPGPQTLDLGPHGKAGIQICYEIIFSGEVVDAANRPAYLFNPSNDGWFGAWGPPQHLAQARMRAAEEGLPVLRATTTGISAVIDAQGRVLKYVPSKTAGRIDGMIPPALPPTLFSRLGNWLPLGWAFALLALSLVATRRRRG